MGYDPVFEMSDEPGRGRDDQPPQQEPVCYCGPTVARFGLNSFAFFCNGLPENVKRAIKEIEEIGRAMIPVSKLGAWRADMECAGTEAHRLYHQIAADAAAEVKDNGI